MDRNLALEFVRITEAAALACARWMGRGDARGADQAAVDAMRRALDSVRIEGTVVLGEGERDEAPMLYVGEKVGGGGAKIEVAVDPLEGTGLCATGGPAAMSMIAAAEDGRFLATPDTYMEKIAVGPAGRGAIDLNRTPTWNLHALAEAKRARVEDLTAVVLDRPRHKALVEEIRKAGARIRFISDGDVAAALATSMDDTGLDILFGTGGAPEGVLAAAALRGTGGELQGRLRYRNQQERAKAERLGIRDHERVYRTEDLAQGDVLFAATGVTDGSLLRGVRFYGDGARTHSVVMRSRSQTIRHIETRHRFQKKPNYGWSG